MKLLEKPLAFIYKALARPYLRTFVLKNPEAILKKSLHLLDAATAERVRTYVTNAQAPSGGFVNKAGKADLYYTLFGLYLAEALGMKDLTPGLQEYIRTETVQPDLTGVHLYCAAILHAKLGTDQTHAKQLREKVRQNLYDPSKKQSDYIAFLSLLACYYLEDFKGLLSILRQFRDHKSNADLPCPVMAAQLVLRKSFNKPVDDLVTDICTFYDGKGGFKANTSTIVPDLLSTAVILYALDFEGADLRMIKPDCLAFIDRLYHDGGFAAHELDQDTDIEYTFYGLLALGALAE